MGKIVQIGGATGGDAQGGSQTRYIHAGQGHRIVEDATEANKQVTFRTAGTLSNLYVRLSTNANAGGETLTQRINAGNGNGTVAIAGTSTGEFEDTTHTDAVSAGDEVNYQMVSGAGTITPNVYSHLFEASSNTVSVFVIGAPALIGTNAADRFFPLVAGSGLSTTEALTQLNIGAAGTLKNGGIYASVNTRSVNVDFKSHINGSNGNSVVTILATTTGWVEDTTHTDTIAQDDLVNWITPANSAGSGSITLSTCRFEFESTSGNAIFGCGAGLTSVQVGATNTEYVNISGAITAAGSSETNCQAQANVAFTASRLWAYVDANTIATGNSTIRLRVTAANVNQVLTVGTAATGEFIDTTHTDAVTATDEICYQLVAGTVGTTFDVRLMSMVQTVASLTHYTMAADTGTYTLTGVAAGTTAQRKITAATGAYTLTGVAANLYKGYKVVATTGSYTLTGPATGLRATRLLALATGTYTLTGIDAGLSRTKSIPAGAGAYVLTGISAGLRAGHLLGAGTGAYVLSGIDVAMSRTYGIPAGVGSYTLTGQATGLRAGHLLTSGTGVYTLTGNDASLVVTPVSTYSMVAGTGSYTLTGIAAGLRSDRTLIAGTGSYTLTGGDVTLTVASPALASGGAKRLRQAKKARDKHDPAQVYDVHAEIRRLKQARKRAIPKPVAEINRIEPQQPHTETDEEAQGTPILSEIQITSDMLAMVTETMPETLRERQLMAAAFAAAILIDELEQQETSLW